MSNTLTYDQLLEIPLADRPCLYTYEGVPDFNSTAERDRWITEEIRRWRSGWLGMTGKHYFYLTQVHLKQGTGGNIIRPHWRQVDHEIFQIIDEAEKNREDFIMVKRREVGASSIFGTLPLYYIMTSPGCITGLTSADTSRISNLFNQKLLVAYDNMHKWFKPVQANLNKTKSTSFLKVKLRKKGQDILYESDVVCNETVDNPKSFSAYRLKLLVIDEFGLHPKRREVIESADDALNESGVREGALFCCGTIEEGIPQESLTEIQRILSLSEEEIRIERKCICFIPAWKGMYKYQDFDDPRIKHLIPHTENGWDNEKFATDIVMRRREQLEKLSDEKKLAVYKKNHPLTIEEVMSATGTGTLPSDLADKVSKQQRYVIREKPPVFGYDVTEDANGNIIVALNEKSPIKIYKLPNPSDPEGTYGAANDPIPFGNNLIGDGSEDCTLIKNFNTQEYVAAYMERNLDPNYVNYKKSLLLKLYKCKMMLEQNRGEVTYRWFMDNGLAHLLARRPVMMGLKVIKGQPMYGVFRNDAKLIDLGNNLFYEYIRHHIDKFMFDFGLRWILKFDPKNLNNDFSDTCIWMEVYHEELRRRNKKQDNQENIETITIPIRTRTGIEFKTVNIKRP